MYKILFLLLFFPSVVSGTTYYVSASGNDKNSGTSKELPWQTINKVNKTTFRAGDKILFKRGDTWTDAVFVPGQSGHQGKVITFGAYDSGADPIITARGSLPGWRIQSNWKNRGSNKWSFVFTGNYRFRIWLSGSEAHRAHYSKDLNSKYRYYFSSDSGYAIPVNELWVYADMNPALEFSEIEISGARSHALNIYKKEYLTFQNLDFRGGGGNGWVCVAVNNSSFITFDSCRIGKDAGCYGIRGDASVNCEVKNCIFDTGDEWMDYYQAENSEDGLSLYDGCSSWQIHDNYFKNWGHTSLGLTCYGKSPVNFNEVYDNEITAPDVDYCRGIGYSGHQNYMNGNKIYRNYIHDMAIRNQLNGPGLEFYNNIICNITGIIAYSNHGENGQGIAIQEYEGHYAQGMKFYNNTLVNCADGGIKFIGWLEDNYVSKYGQIYGIKNNDISNNIIYNCATNSGYSINFDNFPGINTNIFRNNLVYTEGVSNPVFYRGSTYSVGSINEADAYGDEFTANISENPLFVDSTDFHLTEFSPAKGKGYSPALSVTDADGKNWGTPPSIGAYEFSDDLSTTSTVKTNSDSSMIKQPVESAAGFYAIMEDLCLFAVLMGILLFSPPYMII